MGDLDELLMVMHDANLDGKSAVVSALGAEVEAWMGAAEAGGDEHGLWLRFEMNGEAYRLRWIQPGRFLRGSPPQEEGRSEQEGPVRKVTLTRGFWLGETPVTRRIWDAVKRRGPRPAPDKPVVGVEWHDCQDFFRSIGERFPTLMPRLPTEAEWEYACRAGTRTATWAGDLEISDLGAAAVLDDIAWYRQLVGPSPVGQKQPNPWGLYDMLGNVLEWCEDRVPSPLPSHPDREEIDPVGAEGPMRILRGGSWQDTAHHLRAAARSIQSPRHHSARIGFRMAFEPALRPHRS